MNFTKKSLKSGKKEAIWIAFCLLQTRAYSKSVALKSRTFVFAGRLFLNLELITQFKTTFLTFETEPPRTKRFVIRFHFYIAKYHHD